MPTIRPAAAQSSYDAQALTDVAAYLGVGTATTGRVWPGVVQAWAGYLSAGRHGRGTVLDLQVMEAMMRAGLKGTDLSRLTWCP